MPAAETPRPHQPPSRPQPSPTSRKKPSATRIYHSHSRSRQLVALPLSPTHRKGHASKPLHLSPRQRLLILLFISLGTLLASQAPPQRPRSVAGSPDTAHEPATVVVERPAMVRGGGVAKPVAARDAVEVGQVKEGGEDGGVGGEGDDVPGHPGAGEGAVAEAVHVESAVEKGALATGQDGPSGLREAPVPEDGAVAAEEEERREQEQLYRDPADFNTFNEETALNYFHLHKTGGVSFKERLFDFFILEEKQNRKGQKAKVVDTCHMSGPARPALGIEAQWSCDWGEIEVMPEKERNKIDVVVGHQYWEHGAGYWVPNRDLRYFTVMRHPLHRKVSFFYHFFIRNAGRSEDSVSENELIQFVLGKEMPNSPLVRDAGPGYYASRLWSDGMKGYGEYNNFLIPDDSADAMVVNSIRRLRRNFVFIGLQTQEKASLCMLKKTVEEFAKAHGFDNLNGLAAIAKQRERLNTGSYALSGKLLWEKMTDWQKDEFKRIERVDLAIYRESVKMFHEMAKRFSCDHLTVDSDEDSIAL